MKRLLLTLLAPPVAACRYGCAGCCAAPITVFWLTAIVSMVYGVAGGPANLMAPSWNTVGLGVVLWAIASVWTALTIRGASASPARCEGRNNPICERIVPDADEPDPFDEARKAR
jgi:hypothetical protein